MAKIQSIDVIRADVSSILQRVEYETEEVIINPSTEEQTILASPEKYIDKVTANPVTAAIDPDIQAENIKEGINILGVEGTYIGTDTRDATATAEDLIKDKTAYVNGEKITGTLVPLDTSDATAIEGDLISPATAYVNGKKISGTVANNGELNYNPSTSIQAIPEGYTVGGTIAAVTSDIDSNILPENIKKDVTILGVTGTHESFGGGTGEVKLFETEEEMQTDNANEGDLAVVYRSKKVSVEVGKTYEEIYLPETIVFDTAITTNNYIYLNDDQTARLRVYKTMIRFQQGSSNIYEILYRSTDGITFTRQDGIPETLTISEVYDGYNIDSITIQEDNYDIIKQILLIDSKFYGGLFESTSIEDIYKFHFQTITDPIEGGYVPQSIDANQSLDKSLIENTVNSIFTNLGYELNDYVIVRISDTLYDIYAVGCTSKTVRCNPLIYVNGNTYMGKSTLSAAEIEYKISLDITNLEAYTIKVLTTEDITPIDINGSEKESYADISNYSFDTYKHEGLSIKVKYGEDSSTSASLKVIKYFILKYIPAPNQLNASAEYVYEKDFYGINGVETGTLQNVENLSNEELLMKATIWYNFRSLKPASVNMSQAFEGYVGTDIPDIDTSLVTNFSYTFRYCRNFVAPRSIDTSSGEIMTQMYFGCDNLVTAPKLDTSNATRMDWFFSNCTNLVNIPLYDTSKVTNLAGFCSSNTMYLPGCPNLSNESLNNILAMAANCDQANYTTSYDKSLKYLGISEAQATICTGLSNYAAFIAAGWTTGY